jgi:ATP-dependent helicase HepA
MEFAIGQRWVSHADAQLGLGIVVGIDGRRVTLSFPAVGEERTYAASQAPLTRLRFKAGDSLRTADGRELEVEAVQEREGLLRYRGRDAGGDEHSIAEIELDPFVQLTTPRQRLLNGHFDRHEAFALRVATCHHLDRLQRDPARGLLGPRTRLLPHQVYIADTVGRRHAPRVLLADEVGLGKTIEAGMILHQQLLTGRASRVLILVPEPLLHQWLVEMLRRFNLHFALFDRERLAQGDDNPFEMEQLVLCAGELLYEDPLAQALALSAPWDMVVVDEAHHLHWRPEAPGDDYRLVCELAAQSPGLLLLTATPEQLGVESHFARLALLDPARFHDLDAFREEQARYAGWNELLEAIEAGRRPQQLPPGLDEGAGDELLVERILDRHGTGRVLFRNTRASVGGFPRRVLHASALPAAGPAAEPGALYPERSARDDGWLAEDPRVGWLRDTLRELHPHKALVICSTQGTAETLEHYLHLRAGIRCAAFHEQLSIIERDRAAAWFADAESGAQALVCSEIGSEGRNFQFAQHLILFDLPRNPDLLEQRIGRLDRIGQEGEVHIHVPYLAGTAQETLFRWLHEGLGIFERNCPAGRPVFEARREELETQLRGEGGDFETFLEATRRATEAANRQLAAGRDRLLERNACRPAQAETIIEAIRDSERSGELQAYLEELFDALNVEHEYHSEQCLILRTGEHTDTAHFPALADEGRTVTFDRETALKREDMAFLTWEHPLVSDAMDGILSTELGNAALGTLKLRGVAPGTLLLECLYTVNCSAPRQLQLSRFLSLAPQRVLIDSRDRDLSAAVSHERLNQLVRRVDHATAVGIIRQVHGAVDARLASAARLAARQLEQLREDAARRARNHLGEELARLESLQRVNPQVRDEELAHLRWQLDESLAAIERADLHLQAVRLVVTA